MSRFLSIALAFIVITAAALFAPHPGSAYACSCMMPAPPQESLDQSQAVFSGEVIAVDGVGGDPMMNRMITFAVQNVWKGQNGPQVSLLTSDSSASCGYEFVLGQSYLVYAYEQDGQLASGLCTRTALLDSAAADIEALGPGEAPNGGVAGPSDTPAVEEPAGDAASFPWVPIALGAVIVGVLVIGGGIVTLRRNS